MASAMVVHKCTIVNKEDELLSKMKWYHKYRLIAADNPIRFDYFRSDVSVQDELQRHLGLKTFTIHPFSKMRAWYQMYLVVLYGSLLVTKPVDAGFVQYEQVVSVNMYQLYATITDVLSWVDIVVNFITGYELDESNTIELRLQKIIKHYVYGPYFFPDVLSSIPVHLVHHMTFLPWHLGTCGVISLLGLCKIVRVASMLKCICRSMAYLNFKSKGVKLICCSAVVLLITIHWFASMQFAVSRMVRVNFVAEIDTESWLFSGSGDTVLYDLPFHMQYLHCFFKSSAYILGIRLIIYEIELMEDYSLSILTYFLGKIIMCYIWIILAVAILNSRVMDIKFAEIVNQLEEYMKQKQLPLQLRSRILQYFVFKYGNKYFKEQLITSLLSDNLRKEANLHVCRSLITNVSLFSNLSDKEVSKVVDYLIPEIFLPNDTIIHAGTQGDAMYFLSTGTVAVYTRSGKEVCHLQDGAYFGEISLVMKGYLRMATVVALETSHVYRLKKRDLEKCLLTNKSVMNKILKNAEERLKQVTAEEEQYKEQLFEQEFRQIVTAELAPNAPAPK